MQWCWIKIFPKIMFFRDRCNRNENRNVGRSTMWKRQVSGSFPPRCWRSALTSSHCELRVKMLLDSILSFSLSFSFVLSPRTLFSRGPHSPPFHHATQPAYAAHTNIYTNTHAHTYDISLWGPCLTLRSPKIPLEGFRAPSRAANRTEIITGRWACVDCSYSASLTDSEKP